MAISPGEYSSCIGPIAQGKYTFTICEKNDLTNDYYAVTIDDLTNDAGDIAYFIFDNNHDGAIISCASGVEDAFGVSGVGASFDFWLCASGNGEDTTSHGSGAAAFTGGSGYVYEASHPLCSGDSQDYCVSPGSTLGWCFAYGDVTNNGVQFPAGCLSAASLNGDASGFGDVIKRTLPQPPPRLVGGESLTLNRVGILAPWLIVVLALGIVAVQTVAWSRRKSNLEIPYAESRQRESVSAHPRCSNSRSPELFIFNFCHSVGCCIPLMLFSRR